ncbi:MAG: grasp-with-spasm system ATP-grasp peptide maturase [Cyclobacteriaceae bacterium]
MILILSQSDLESSSDQVIEWLDTFNVDYKRINGIDFYQNLKLSFHKSGPKFSHPAIDLSIIKLVWFRRWMSFNDLKLMYLDSRISGMEYQDNFKTNFNNLIGNEQRNLAEFFFRSIPKEKHFSRLEYQEINKLEVLQYASEVGLEIPETHILTSRLDLNEIIQSGVYITKAIANAPTIRYQNEKFLAYTAEVANIEENLGESFSPSLFQKLIEKKYEIRSFLLDDEIYSMAIFSQKDEQTKLDFRQYNYARPNRNVPIKLPSDIKFKLLKIAKKFSLRTGSFDLIKTKENKYIFLEVNPEGQFGMVSYPCNYYLEKKIALKMKELINYE